MKWKIHESADKHKKLWAAIKQPEKIKYVDHFRQLTFFQ